MSNTWIDNLREWNYEAGPVLSWICGVIEYNAQRHGPIAYAVTALVVLILLLTFPPTRSLTKTVCGGIFTMLMTYSQIVFSLITVHLLVAVAKLSLSLFHKCRVWVVDQVQRAKEK